MNSQRASLLCSLGELWSLDIWGKMSLWGYVQLYHFVKHAKVFVFVPFLHVLGCLLFLLIMNSDLCVLYMVKNMHFQNFHVKWSYATTCLANGDIMRCISIQFNRCVQLIQDRLGWPIVMLVSINLTMLWATFNYGQIPTVLTDKRAD